MQQKPMSTFPQNLQYNKYLPNNYGQITQPVDPVAQIQQNIEQTNRDYLSTMRQIEERMAMTAQIASTYGVMLKRGKDGTLVTMTVDEFNAMNNKTHQPQQSQTQPQASMIDKIAEMVDRHSAWMCEKGEVIEKIAAELGIKETPQAQDKQS
jgi:hypothetical protein